MKIANFSVERPVAISMLILTVVFIGLYALPNLGVALMPDMSIPVITINTSYSGAAPAEVEKVITKPIESAVSSVSGIKEINSESSTGNSMIMVQFDYGSDLDDKMNDLRSKIDSVRSSLPDDANSPTLSKIDLNSQAIMTYSLTGASLAKMKEIAEDTIQPALERIEGVSSVSIRGGKEREIQVRLDQAKMDAYGLTIQQVSQALSGDDITGTAGQLVRGSSEISIRVMNEFDNLDVIKDVQISVPGSSGNHIPLSDIAEVSDSFKKDSSLTYVNGEPSLTLSVRKASDGNTVQVAKKVYQEVAGLNKTLTDGVKMNIVSDTSTTITDAVKSVEEHGLLGGLLAVIILFLFMRSARSTAVVAITLPIALIGTFSAMYFADITINMLSLGGLMLGLGSLVDFAIVVLESIYRKRQEGLDVINAAKVGTAEVGTAVMASAASQIVVFMPIVFVSGIASMIFKPLALTVSFSHACALFAALTLVPMMSSRMLKNVPAPEEFVYKKGDKNPVTLFGYGLQKIISGYKRLLSWALQHRKTVVAATVLLFITSLGCIPLIGMEFMSSMDERGVNITIEMPTGTMLEVTQKKAEEIDNLAKKAIGDGIDTDNITVGGGNNPFAGTSEANNATIQYKLKSTDEYKVTSNGAAEKIRQAITDVVGATITVEVEESAMGMSGSAVDVIIRGSDLDILTELGNNAVEIIKGVSGTRNVSSSLSSNIQMQIVVDRERAAQYGISVSQILSAIKTAFGGLTVGSLHTGDNTVDISLRYSKDYANTESTLSNMVIVSSSGAKVPLRDVANIAIKNSPKEISRSNQNREVAITADVSGVAPGSVNSEIQQKLAQLTLPQGYTIDYSGDQQNMNESFSALGTALILAIVLVFMVMAAQFESLFQPFIIMFSLPPTFIGVVIGLGLTGTRLNVMSLIGAIMLIGIVLNNAIVLVDYINTLRKRGIERNDAVIQAGPIRLRPILMTTLCTVLALMPMALGGGTGNELMKPMAIVIAFGLTFSTLITLILVPVVYTIFDDLYGRIIKRFSNSPLFRQKHNIQN
ncbi:hydrophobic/amphiphilic exporter-1, HAE1 family [Desulfotomaculum arcticum]|uniref:Hydrophobic/amphiphilic exporter-1, HAE1 family n=1 Tax=Desulfotruncus arcticus DSM 17038 TaxID=1121424 RepID=A0A1I2XPG7_9FIRM|nr:efflux RND transporter permease subunit [Desulfotruncus arcticus]SFH15398.1 hydrophobic/amphiphilic exporter-1, HAE1 family [Desulfotomaculum arcticum] [Desulfotruncus arcticus DSM 17038]